MRNTSKQVKFYPLYSVLLLSKSLFALFVFRGGNPLIAFENSAEISCVGKSAAFAYFSNSQGRAAEKLLCFLYPAASKIFPGAHMHSLPEDPAKMLR